MCSVEKRDFVKTCVVCRLPVVVSAFENDVREWKTGKLIQDAMPYLSVDEREILISGVCGKCFDAQFSDE